MSARFVVDSSVIVKWINSTDEKHTEEADEILSDAVEGKIELFAPELAKYEVGNVLLLSKKLPVSEIMLPFHTLFVIPIQFIKQAEDLANATYSIAKNTGITYYDASFIALAQQEDATLVTDNPKHQGKFKGVKVIPLADY